MKHIELLLIFLYMNEIIEEDFVLNDKNIGKIKMPNAEGFLHQIQDQILQT